MVMQVKRPHAHAQPSVSRDRRSALSRRAIMLPSGVQLSAKIQCRDVTVIAALREST